VKSFDFNAEVENLG